MFAIAASFPAALTIRESLWVDELHTSWSVTTNWSHVASRAAEGNQSPVYYWLLRGFLSMVPENEVTLRLPSLLAWMLMSIGIAKLIESWPSQSMDSSRDGLARIRLLGMFLIAIWLAIDRIGMFYAVEARPYAMIALASLLLIACSSHSKQDVCKINWLWIFVATTCFYMHYTAFLIVVASCVGRVCAALLGTVKFEESGPRWKSFSYRLCELAAFAIGTLPAWYGAATVMKQRQMWAYFAADASVWSALGLLPVVPWCLVPVGFAIYFSRSDRSFESGRKNFDEASRAMLIQLIAVATIPILLAWSATLLNIAPMMHRRYVIGSYPAILMLGAWGVMSLVSVRQLAIVGILSTSLLVLQQGTWQVWRSGQIVGWQRGEDWSSAITWINQHAEDQDVLILAPRLIETATLESSQSKPPEYLQFPLGGLYPCKLKHRTILMNDQSLESHLHGPGRYWFLARVNPEKLTAILTSVTSTPSAWSCHIEKQQDFGNLQLVELRIGK